MPIDPQDNRYKYRRQFILSRAPLPRFAEWHSLEVADRYYLHVHPDLNCLQVTREDKQLTLIGFIVDPYHPESRDSDILQELLWTVRNHSDLFRATGRYGGRWILIFSAQNQTTMHGDAGGLRQVCYTVPSCKELLCASQPGLLADELHLKEDEVAVREFKTPEVNPAKEYWWPGDRSLFAEVRHLLPNHYLTLEGQSVQRFWPQEPVEPSSIESVIEEACRILRGQCVAAANRFKLAQSLTAGLDSRTVLAALRGHTQDVFFYTLIYRSLTMESPDLRIPARLLSRFGLRHHAIETPPSMSGEFEHLYRTNVLGAHDCWGNIVQGLDSAYPEDHVQVNGIVSEIARCCYYRNGEHPEEIRAIDLVRVARMAETPFIEQAFNEWLQDAKPAARVSGIQLLDLFYWEQRVGRWAASSLVELDLVQETFTPFNHRQLLLRLLSTPPRWRCRPTFRLHRRMIRTLWPAVLQEPVNPLNRKARMKDFVVSMSQRFFLDRPMRRLYRSVRR